MTTRSLDPLQVDLVVEPSSGDSLFVVRPCHRRAANWLNSIGEGVALDHRRVDDLIVAAVRSGFTVEFALAAPTGVVEGLPATAWAH
jgi:hypothetical protein